MLIYYCAKCQKQNVNNVCESCGKGLPGTSARFIWSDYRMSLGDAVKLGQAFRLPLIALSLLITVMLALEYILTGSRALIAPRPPVNRAPPSACATSRLAKTASRSMRAACTAPA